MIRWTKIGLLGLGLALLVSCKGYYQSMTIENALPAKGELPEDIQSLTLMNRSMTSQFANFQEDSLQNYFYRNGYNLSKIILDSVAADTTIQALAALLFESGRYDVVVPVARNFFRTSSYEQVQEPLPNDTVADICRRFNTDALMVMERFYTKTMTDYTKEQTIDNYSGFVNSYYATLDVKYDAVFRIYKPNSPVVNEFEITDTIYWENADIAQDLLFNKIPKIKQALISAGIKIALDTDNKISPTWITDKRGYFLFSRKNDKGEQLMNENKIDEAGMYWAELAKSKDRKIRSKAEFNMALVSELNGDIDAAIDWGVKSYYSQYRNQTEIYLKKLQARKETITKK